MLDSASPGMLPSRHRRWIRVVALLLMVLAASPVTAPFSTLDLDPASPSPAADASKSKSPDDQIVDVSAIPIALAAAEPRSTRRPAGPPARPPRESRPLVLRL